MKKYENAPCIPPIVGERMIMRNGGVTERFTENDDEEYPFKAGEAVCTADVWTADGRYIDGEVYGWDIVARYIDPVALTENRIAHGLLDPETRAAMEAWEHGWEIYRDQFSSVRWRDITEPRWSNECTYRAKPAPEPVNEVPEEPLTSDEIRSIREILKERSNV